MKAARTQDAERVVEGEDWESLSAQRRKHLACSQPQGGQCCEGGGTRCPETAQGPRQREHLSVSR